MRNGYKVYIKEDVPINRSDNPAYEYLHTNEKDIKELKKKDPDVDQKDTRFYVRQLLRYPDVWRCHDDFRKGRSKLRAGSRTCAAGICAQCGTGRPAGSDHYPRCDYNGADAENKGTEMGRKHIIPYGLYRAEGYVSANLARKVTGFSEEESGPALGGHHQYV